MDTRIEVRIQTARFDPSVETTALANGLGEVGAIVSFVGVCRSESGRLAALELEHYPGMAEAEITRIAVEAAERWNVHAIGVVHRSGRVAVGEEIVLAAVIADHRGPAFHAAEFLMDYLKTQAPFWKKEIAADGSAGAWVQAKTTDNVAAERWRSKAAE